MLTRLAWLKQWVLVSDTRLVTVWWLMRRFGERRLLGDRFKGVGCKSTVLVSEAGAYLAIGGLLSSLSCKLSEAYGLPTKNCAPATILTQRQSFEIGREQWAAIRISLSSWVATLHISQGCIILRDQECCQHVFSVPIQSRDVSLSGLSRDSLKSLYVVSTSHAPSGTLAWGTNEQGLFFGFGRCHDVLLDDWYHCKYGGCQQHTPWLISHSHSPT